MLSKFLYLLPLDTHDIMCAINHTMLRTIRDIRDKLPSDNSISKLLYDCLNCWVKAKTAWAVTKALKSYKGN